MSGVVIRRRPARPRVVRETAPARAEERVVRGWVDLRGEIRGEMRRLGKVDATDPSDLVTERWWG